MGDSQAVRALDKKTRNLIQTALDMRKFSYAPYSKFRVGCALVDEKGRVFTGCNVETVAFNNSLHAEMVALAKMVSSGGRQVKRIVVVTSFNEPLFPCGFCLQYLSEFGSGAEVVAVNRRGTQYQKTQISHLLPYNFERKHVEASTC